MAPNYQVSGRIGLEEANRLAWGRPLGSSGRKARARQQAANGRPACKKLGKSLWKTLFGLIVSRELAVCSFGPKFKFGRKRIFTFVKSGRRKSNSVPACEKNGSLAERERKRESLFFLLGQTCGSKLSSSSLCLEAPDCHFCPNGVQELCSSLRGHHSSAHHSAALP